MFILSLLHLEFGEFPGGARDHFNFKFPFRLHFITPLRRRPCRTDNILVSLLSWARLLMWRRYWCKAVALTSTRFTPFYNTWRLLKSRIILLWKTAPEADDSPLKPINNRPGVVLNRLSNATNSSSNWSLQSLRFSSSSPTPLVQFFALSHQLFVRLANLFNNSE